MKISQPERGGNGVRAAVVNQTFLLGFLGLSVDLRASLASIARKSRGLHPCPVPVSDNLLQQIITRRGLSFWPLNLFDCAPARSFCGWQGRKGFVR
jgi:hypothetical protein